ncbi:MAG: hypothetical protein H7177_00225 [Rhizobacter sp.]|nr:hypothetical protein [Bacteriovorax sp.]
MKLYLLLFTLLFNSRVLHAVELESEAKIFNYVNSNNIRVENIYYITAIPHQILSDQNQELFSSINPFEPFNHIHHIAKVNNQLIYDQTYETAELGLRTISSDQYNPNANKHLIIAGDSNTFGIGVKQEETLPVLLSKKMTDYHPYNFGIRGGGPHNTLAMLEFMPWKNLINEPAGIFIYNYYDFLIDRVIGSKDYLDWMKGNAPYYQLNSSDEVEYAGNFGDLIISKIFMVISSVKWLNSLFPVLPRHRYQHSILLGKVFLKMQSEYKSKFPDGKFIVAINYIFDELVPNRLKELEEELKLNHIKFIIIPKQMQNIQIRYPEENHLNVNGHKTEAELFLKNLP